MDILTGILIIAINSVVTVIYVRTLGHYPRSYMVVDFLLTIFVVISIMGGLK